jgi:hypothetical protein
VEWKLKYTFGANNAKNADIHMRDPFVLPSTSEKQYYLYGTIGSEAWTGAATGIDYYIGTDLQNWEGPFPAFRPPAGFWADRNFWAPEVHAYQGRHTRSHDSSSQVSASGSR